MNQRRLFAAVGLAGALAVAACGAEDQVTKPAAQPANASQNAAEAFQHYYDVTHPAPKKVVRFNGDAKDHPGYGQISPAAQKAAEAFQHYYDVTRPAPRKAVTLNGDAKDHPGYGQISPAAQKAAEAFQHYYDVTRPAPRKAVTFNGDAKDHPRYGQIESPAFNGDAKDHPGYGQTEPAGNQVLPLRASQNLDAQRVSMQVELAALAIRDGLTGLSPAFLQRVEVCSGLSPASTSGCTVDELNAALPGNPR